MIWLALLVPLLAACDQMSDAGRVLKGGAGELGAAHGEVLCLLYSAKCGHVWACEEPADNALGMVEVCVQVDQDMEEVEAQFGSCVATPRHAGLCYWHCGEGAGCNAFSGCYCPKLR